MIWKQLTDPFNNIALSALVAILPILFIFWALIIKKMKGYQASLLALAIALLLAILVYRMPASLALLAAANGALYGLFPICWIVINAVFLFNITVASGQFTIIKHFMGGVTADRRLQALLIAFSFGAFLEGTAGFGAPVAITAAMLVALGFEPLYAAGICLIANTAPVAFGSIGIPITVAAQVSGLPEMAISQMVGRTLPVLSLLLPFYLVVLMAGWRRAVEVLPAALVSGISFSLLQWLTSNYAGPALPDIIAGVGSIISLIVFLRFWKVKTPWRFPQEPAPAAGAPLSYSRIELLRAWSPFILLTIIVITWGLQPVKQVFTTLAPQEFAFPGLHNKIADINGKALAHIFKFNYLAAAGTAILLAALVAAPIIGVSYRNVLTIFKQTLQQLRYPILTICAVLAFAYTVNDAGITLTIAAALAGTGVMFPFFAPVLGWLGVFITGSDTSANALFGKLQASTAASIGVDPVITVGANVSGGVVGKMISPQSIAVAAAAGNLVGREAALFRFTVKHSFIMLVFICCLVLAQAYLFTGLPPAYQTVAENSGKVVASISSGYAYLSALVVLLLAFALFIRYFNRPKQATS